MSHTEKPCRAGLTLNFGQAGESAKKRVKMQNYIQETPELAKIFPDPVPHTKLFSPLQTPDLLKIQISTPLLDSMAFDANLGPAILATPGVFSESGSAVLRGSTASTLPQPAPAANRVTMANPITLVSLSAGQFQQLSINREANFEEMKGQKRLRSQVDEQTLQHANNLMMLSSHSEHSISSTDSHNHVVTNIITNGEIIQPLNNQEMIKQNRKRERNRIAASRCRLRKLERISTLQEDVTKLQEKNDKLQKYIEYVEELIARRENTVCAHMRFNCEY